MLAFLGAALFLQLGCFGLDITSFCIANHKDGYKLPLVLPFNLFFFSSLLQELLNKEAIIVYIAFCLIKYLTLNKMNDYLGDFLHN